MGFFDGGLQLYQSLIFTFFEIFFSADALDLGELLVGRGVWFVVEELLFRGTDKQVSAGPFSWEGHLIFYIS